MSFEKNKKATALFRAIGGIDDRLITEAMIYRPQKSALPRVFLIAACLALSLMLSVGAFLITMHPTKDEIDVNAPTDDGLTAQEELDAILLAEVDTQDAVTSADSIDFFGGKAYVVWQRTDTEEIFVSRALTAREVEALTNEIPKGTQINEDDSEPLCRVWIVLGDGTAVSPHLKSSDGNVGVGELFEYHAELIPSNAFNSKISEILN